MDKKSAEAIIESILETEPDAPMGPSNPLLARLTELANAGDLKSFSELFVAFARAKRRNAAYVEAKIPAKIIEAYLIRQPGITRAAVQDWQLKEPQWATDLKEAVWSPTIFEGHVLAIAQHLRAAG